MTLQNEQTNAETRENELHELLKNLGIQSLMNDNLDTFLEEAVTQNWSHKTMLQRLVKQELLEREHRSLAFRLRDSKIGSFAPMADFNWGWPDNINRSTIERLLTADFVEKKENVVLIGTQGLGKTMIAKNIVHNAVHKGHTALFIQASQMLVDLGMQDSISALERKLKHYIKPELLCIDEIGYLSYDQHAADLLFQIVSRRYEKRSIIVTTNLAFNDWPTVFPGATSVASLIDRLIHHSEITLIEGQSYRKHQALNKKSAEKKVKKS